MKIFFASLGCDKNLVDSEKMLSLIDKAGHTIIDDETTADVIVVNTCAFINDAMEESINSIIEYGKYKTIGNLKALIVTGCLAQRYKQEVFDELPEVDAVIGTNSYDKIIDAIEKAVNGNHNYFICDDLDKSLNLRGRMLSTGGHYAYLKISEGCNKRCTYCIIPSLRGNYRSFPMEDIIDEAKQLVRGGVKELILVAQDTGCYGYDLYGKKKLPKLLDELQAIDELRWIRILYCYPEEIDDALIDAIMRNDKVCHYIDMPIQHCNDNILKSMGRRTNRASLDNIINKLRTTIPDIVIRTTLITGFPGEGKCEFDELVEFVRDNHFERLGVFAYSRQEGTLSYDFDNQVDDDIKNARLDEIMDMQMHISHINNDKLIGCDLDVFVEGFLPEDNTYVGRTYRDAPGVDGYFFIHTDETLNSGDYVRCRVTSCNEYDLIGVTL